MRLRFKSYMTLAWDVAAAPVAFIGALILRYGLGGYEITSHLWLEATLILVPVSAIMFLAFGLHRGVWRYVSMRDLVMILQASALVVLFSYLALFAYNRLETMPRTVPFINYFLLVALLAGPRLLLRIRAEGGLGSFSRTRKRRGEAIPVLLVGAGAGTELFLREVDRGNTNYQPVAILDETGKRVGRSIRGLPIMGGLDDMAAIVASLEAKHRRPQRAIVTKRELNPELLHDLLARTEKIGLPLSRVPDMGALETSVGTNRVEVRQVQVEDLLGRPQKRLDREAMRGLIAGRRVLVTGAGGSIGSELVRQVTDLGPSEIALVDLSEFALYTIDMEVSERWPDLRRHMILADVRDPDRMGGVIGGFAPDIVFHAAALKHVPLVEGNIEEGVLTNVIGTRHVADACRAHGVGVVVLISSDKAVNPANVMGATKRLAEAYAQALDIECARGGAGPRFVTVRFGNVLGSTGSVVPLFQRQLAAGGPLTVTHPEITRYFMTIREAVELVLASAAHRGVGNAETGRIHVLDMGDPVRIQDLARMMIRLAGLRPDRDVEIAFTGLRPGEKLYEELLHNSETDDATAVEGVFLASPRAVDLAILRRALDELMAHARARRTDRTLTLLKELVPEFKAEVERTAQDVSGGSRK
ncbi:MAG: nucleoside-diphosphate sugar epimerase/dehydratase [Minwuia sp.]|nr:nucleoside-diphosphate sugar epimerase/dehydratase [Minwuia sp.]